MLTEKIRETIELLKGSGINGCIAGSSMIPGVDFDEWESVPDVDVFVYTEMQLLHAADVLVMRYGFEPCTAGEEWKLDRVKNRGMQNNASLTTLKFEKDGVVVNVTHKKYKSKITDVLSSFDMSIIMIGYDIPHGFGLDLRCNNGVAFDDDDFKWSDDPMVAVPNPLRDQDVDMYGTEMWVRQFSRVIKYWNRGFDTRPMAEFYIDLIEGVIEKGQLFNTNKSSEAYKEFVETYEPLRDKMVEWLKDKEEL